ncbi:MAG: metal-dependent hydrolase [Gemmatimonadetes bacterium]|nr:metal-dependent hydrolase [Gemmatimonadota bacterium]
MGAALWPWFQVENAPKRAWLIGAAVAVIPDLDVIGFRFGIAYGDLLGHRGLTHSLLVAVAAGAVVAFACRGRMPDASQRIAFAAYLALAMASHGLLDTMTSGGLGVALLAPFDNARYFGPWRPIEVSPIGIRPFFTARGLSVLANEAGWVGLPALLIALAGVFARRSRHLTSR